MKSTGPILAVGAITLANESIIHDRPVDWRVPIATGITAGVFTLIEKAWKDAAVALAYMALIVILFTRTKKNVPSPVESFVKMWNGEMK